MYRPLIIAAVAAIVAGPADAHVSFENAQAAVGTTYKAALRIPHGCDGKATDEVRVPEGVIAIKPMPKAGWTIEKTVTGYKAEYDLHGKEVAEGVTELSWSGGSVADDEYDAFVFRATLDASLPAGPQKFRVIQLDAAREPWSCFRLAEHCEADLMSGTLESVLDDWCQPFPGPFLYFPEWRLMPAGLRAFVDFVKQRRRHEPA